MTVDRFGNRALDAGSSPIGLAKGGSLLATASGENGVMVDTELESPALLAVGAVFPQWAGLAGVGREADFHHRLAIMVFERRPIDRTLALRTGGLLVNPIYVKACGGDALGILGLPATFLGHWADEINAMPLAAAGQGVTGRVTGVYQVLGG